MGARESFTTALEKALRPDERISISEWAQEYRVLPKDSTEPGKWRNSRTPCIVGIMEALSPKSDVQEVWFKKAHQIAGSASGENFIGHAITKAAGNILAVFATLDDADKWVLTRFEPMRQSTKELRKRVKDREVKGSDNTKRRKKFPGGVLQLVGSNRTGGLKSMTARYIFLEEINEYKSDLNEQGNPIDIAKGRASNFGRKKRIYGNSTPGVKGRCAIDQQFRRGDQRYFFAPCPSCGHRQRLLWENMKCLEKDDPKTVRYVCQACGEYTQEHQWKRLFQPDMWRPTAVGEPGVASFHLSALYAPMGWRPWPTLMSMYWEALKDPVKMKLFMNNELGECSAPEASKYDSEKLAARREPLQMRMVPPGYFILTLGVDTQNNRLACQLVAWGPNERSVVLDYFEIMGDPAISAGVPGSPWDELDVYRKRGFRNAFGIDMRIEMTAIDAMGHRTHDVYKYVRARQFDKVIAIHGVGPGRPILGKPTKQDVKGQLGGTSLIGLAIWAVGGNTAKCALFARLEGDGEREIPADRMVRFTGGLPNDYFEMLTNEVFDEKLQRWVKIEGRRNEALDTYVYSYAAACHPNIRVHTMNTAEWSRLERLLQPRIADLFDRAAAIPAADVSETVPVTQAAVDAQNETAKPTAAAVPAPVPHRPVTPGRLGSDSWGSRL